MKDDGVRRRSSVSHSCETRSHVLFVGPITSPTPILCNCSNLLANAPSCKVMGVFTHPRISQESAEQTTFADLNGFVHL